MPALSGLDMLISSIQKARTTASEFADEHEPYKNKYAAADMLKQLESASWGHMDNKAADEVVAWCKLERGLQLLDTDLLAEGQKVLEEGLAYPWPSTVECLAIQLQAHNALAALWCERSENATALKHLQAAADLHSHIKQQQSDSMQEQDATASRRNPGAEQSPSQQQEQPTHQQEHTSQGDAVALGTATAAAPCQPATPSPASSSSSSGRWQTALMDADQVERDHTTTLFYMAQVYGLMGDKMKSASYCAATLNRQLKQGDVDLNGWVQNCLQLSGCFLDCNAFALSKHCCAAVETLLLREHKQQQQQHQPAQQQASSSCDTPLIDTHCKDTAEQQQQQAHGPGKDQAEKPVLQLKGAASKPQSEQDDSGSCGLSAPLVAALSLLDKDVAANVCLAFAKLHLYSLVASHEYIVEGKQVAFAYSSAADVPSVLCFDALPGLPALPSLPWGPAALARDAEGALQLFKTALPWFKRALQYYQLDGWVTEHCNILFEMSNLYRCLAGFESDPHKRCVMHRNRAKLLQPLEGQLSTTHYPGLSCSISLELGNIFREIADIKAAAGREPDKVAGAMQSAAQHYKLFLDSFKDPSGQAPDKVEPEMEQHYLSGMFSMARMLQGLPGTGTLGSSLAHITSAGTDKCRGDIVMLEQAVSLLGSLATYVRTNDVTEWQEQASMATELSSLLQEKLSLIRDMHQL